MAGFFSYFTGPDVSKEQDVVDATKKRDDAKTALATAETELTNVTKTAKARLKAQQSATVAPSGTVPGSELPSNSGGRRRKHKGGKHTKRHKMSKRGRTGRKSSRL